MNYTRGESDSNSEAAKKKDFQLVPYCGLEVSSLTIEAGCMRAPIVPRPIKKLGRYYRRSGLLTFLADLPLVPQPAPFRSKVSSSESILNSVENLMATAIRLLSFRLASAVQSIQFWRTCTSRPIDSARCTAKSVFCAAASKMTNMTPPITGIAASPASEDPMLSGR